MKPVKISYYSDVLCIWAYVGQKRLEQLVTDFGDQIQIEPHFCSVFPDARGKIEEKWATRGTYDGFNSHVNEVAASFPHVNVNDRLWLDTRPRSSGTPHLFLKAIELIETEDSDASLPPYLERISTRAAWVVRAAFFRDGRDISCHAVHREIAGELDLDFARIETKIHSAEAVAELARDYHMCTQHGIEGSPTYVLNNGRQKLFGNVGYRLIEANVQELIRSPGSDDASWC
jgi:predicted DsbA family dithiol-disulfide isomerase